MDISIFKNRCETLMNILGEGVLVLSGATLHRRNGDVDYPFRQESDFWYLTGFNEPDSHLILKKTHKGLKRILLVPPKDKEKEIWNGKRAGVEGAVEDFGVDESYPNSEFSAVLKRELGGSHILFYEFFKNSSTDTVLMDVIKDFRMALQKRNNPVFPTTIKFWYESLAKMRQYKDAQEIELTKQAVAVTKQAFESLACAMKAGMNEAELYAELEYNYLKNKGAASFGTIIAGGANATCLHYTENDADLQQGDLVLVDSGCEIGFLAADVTRCYPVGGIFTEKNKIVYEAVLNANKAAIKKCKPGATLDEVHEAAADVLAQELVSMGVCKGTVEEVKESGDLGKYFMHKTSHWLGLDVHDVGIYSEENEPVKFKPGMMFTVEPGLYFNPDFSETNTEFDGIGVRIEDDILITENGCEVLSRDIAKEADEIELLMKKQ
jgi:Xaa-Pro aminopeptidase